MQNATTATAVSFVSWAALEAERSPRFRAGIERLRRQAAGAERRGYPRSTGPLSACSWAELERELAQARRLEQAQRPHAWKNTPLPTDDGLRHLRDYLHGCRKLARTLLGSEALAPRLHELVTRRGYLASAPALGPPAPVGGQASQLAAHISGASWGAGATAHAQAWRRARPRQLDVDTRTFVH